MINRKAARPPTDTSIEALNIGKTPRPPRDIRIDDILFDAAISRPTFWRWEAAGKLPPMNRCGRHPTIPFRDWNCWMLENFGRPSRYDPDQRTARERLEDAHAA
ncbi:MAG: hypothetical protein JXQ99_28375 [Hyphomicrobiaceae bacterium]